MNNLGAMLVPPMAEYKEFIARMRRNGENEYEGCTKFLRWQANRIRDEDIDPEFQPPKTLLSLCKARVAQPMCLMTPIVNDPLIRHPPESRRNLRLGGIKHQNPLRRTASIATNTISSRGIIPNGSYCW